MCSRCNLLNVIRDSGQPVAADIRDLVHITAGLMAGCVDEGREGAFIEAVAATLREDYKLALEARDQGLCVVVGEAPQGRPH